MTEHVKSVNVKRKSNLMKFGVPMGGLVIVLVIALITMFVMKSQPAQTIDTNKFQVVYLTNGQAYFGKLQNISGDFLVIKTPYTAQDVVASDDKADDATQTALLKVTSQVYGPEDSIAIKSSQVAFWQNLRDDSKVVQAIKAKE